VLCSKRRGPGAIHFERIDISIDNARLKSRARPFTLTAVRSKHCKNARAAPIYWVHGRGRHCFVKGARKRGRHKKSKLWSQQNTGVTQGCKVGTGRRLGMDSWPNAATTRIGELFSVLNKIPQKSKLWSQQNIHEPTSKRFAHAAGSTREGLPNAATMRISTPAAPTQDPLA
jgi:hypothetical protein